MRYRTCWIENLPYCKFLNDQTSFNSKAELMMMERSPPCFKYWTLRRREKIPLLQCFYPLIQNCQVHLIVCFFLGNEITELKSSLHINCGKGVEFLPPLNKSVYLPIVIQSTLKVSEVENCLFFLFYFILIFLMQPGIVARTLLEWLLQVGQVSSPCLRAPWQPDRSLIVAGLHVPLAG